MLDSHKYRRLPMVPVEDFVNLHPEHADDSDHDLTVARIQDEHAARQGLEEQRQTLNKRKEVLLKETMKEKDELAQLDHEVEKWLTGQENVKNKFDARENKTTDARHGKAR